MNEFFHSKIAKLFAAIAVVLLALLLRASLTQGSATVFSNAISLITLPLEKVSSAVGSSVGGFLERYTQTDALYEENQQLKEQLRILTENQVELEKYRWENESLRKFMGLKEEHPDYECVMASVVSREPNSRFGSFTIDKGALDGVSYLDPIITQDGLVGRVSEVGLSFAKVTTILDPGLSVGCYNPRTRDMGSVRGQVAAAEEGLCAMELVARSSDATAGDIIVTAGSTGLFPKDLVIGRIVSITNTSDGKSMTALLEPAAEIEDLTNVLVITAFRGQGSSVEDLEPNEAPVQREEETPSAEPAEDASQEVQP